MANIKTCLKTLKKSGDISTELSDDLERRIEEMRGVTDTPTQAISAAIEDLRNELQDELADIYKQIGVSAELSKLKKSTSEGGNPPAKVVTEGGKQVATQKRAQVGGEFGANGEWYEGGKFIATTDRAKSSKKWKKPTGKQLVDKGEFDNPPETADNIYASALFKQMAGIEIFNPDGTFRLNGKLGDYLATPEALEIRRNNVDAWNKGARWQYVLIKDDGSREMLAQYVDRNGNELQAKQLSKPINEKQIDISPEQEAPVVNESLTTEPATSTETPDGKPAATNATRSKPKTRITFDGITGPTGAKLTGYEWAWKPYAYVDRLGEDREGRESDWDNAESNVETGRDIVHKFTVEQNGKQDTVSLETALQLLGFAEAGTLSVKGVANTAKRVAKIKMAIAEMEPVADAYDKAKAEVDAMPYPDVVEDGSGWKRMGAAKVRWTKDSDDAERMRVLKEAWRDDRMNERGFKSYERTPHQVISDLKDKLSRAEKKLAENVKSVSTPAQPAQSKPESAKRTEQKPGAKIDDFGEKLGGARKDLAAAMSKEYSDEEIASLPLSKVWPATDIDAIEDKYIAAVAFASRQEVPAKPRVAYKVAAWVNKIKAYRGFMADLVAGKISVEKHREKLKEWKTLEGFYAKVTLLEAIDRDQWKRIGKVGEYPDAYTYDADGKKVPVPQVSVEIDGKRERFTGAGSVGEVIDKINEKLGGEVEAKRMQFEIRGREGAYFIHKAGDSLYRKLKTFSTTKDAIEYRSNNYDDLVAAWEAVKASDNVKETDVRRDENRPRTAQDWRNGKDVTPDQFQAELGFRGIEFGNWVSQGKGGKERQGMLNQAYDALMDLADIIGVPQKAMSLNGSLGLGFGSRGSGKFAAHFEPDMLVINLTKTRGAGSLAHEWFHALDNYFQSQRGKGYDYITNNPENYYVHRQSGTKLPSRAFNKMIEGERVDGYGTIFPKYRDRDQWELKEGVRTEVAEAFADLVKSLNESPMAKRASLIDKGKSGGYWSRIIERGARSFENYVIHKMALKGYDNDYLANVTSIEDFVRDAGRYPYLLEGEIQPVADAFDNLFSTIKTKETDKGVAMFSRGQSQANIHEEDFTAVIQKARQAFPGLPFHALEDESQAPAKLKEFIVDADASGDVAGAFHDGEVYMFRNGLRDVEHAEHTIVHEATHAGLSRIFGEAIGPVMLDIKRSNLKVAGKAGELQKKYGYSVTRATEEVLADIGPEISKLKGFDKLVAFVRDQLRKAGFVREWTDNDIKALVLRALEAAKKPQAHIYRRSALDAMLARVYHGTPHIWAPEPGFPHGRPRLDKMGTGEGAQAFGWGVYLASVSDVADSYRKNLSDRFGGRLGPSTKMPSAPNKSLSDGAVVHAKELGKLLVSDPFIKQGFGGLDVPGRRMMMSHVIGLLHDDKIFKSVVRDIPVDMMDVLVGGKGATDSILNDKPMFIGLLTANKERLVSSGSLPSTVLGLVTARDAAVDLGGLDVATVAGKVLPAEIANKINFHVVSIPHPYSDVNGSLYQLDIPDDVLPNLLDWDKPLSQQTPEVRKSLESWFNDYYGRVVEKYGDRFTKEDIAQSIHPYESIIQEFQNGIREPKLTDRQAVDVGDVGLAYRSLNKASQSTSVPLPGAVPNYQKAASEYLASLGIVGNRYLDGQSRADGAGSFNYVIWDQPTLDRIALLERNGEKLDAIREADAKFSRMNQDRGAGDNFTDQNTTQPGRDIPDTITIDGKERFSRSGQSSGRDNAFKALRDKFAKPQSEPASQYAELNRRVREEHITVMGKASKWMKRQLSPGGLLPSAVFQEKIKRDSEFQAIEFDVEHLISGVERAIKSDYKISADGLDEKTRVMLSDVMAGKLSQDVPEGTKTALLGMRKYIDGMTIEYLNILDQQRQELEDTGSDDAAERAALMGIIAGNVGKYVHRSYRAFDDKTWPLKVPDEVLDKAREYLRAQYDVDANNRAEVVLNEILKHGTAYESMEAFIKESKLGAKDLSVLKKRQDIAPEIRALLGEYTDPRINFAKSSTKMGRLIWNQRFLDHVRDLGVGSFLFTDETKPPEATVQIAGEQSDVYAPLNGMWTTPEVAQAFKDALGKEQMADWYRTIVQINGAVKYGKTVLSPTTAARNWMSAFFFTMANGHFDMKHMRKSVQGFKEYFGHRSDAEKMAYLRELKQLGVVYDTPYAGEMMRLLADMNMADTLVYGKGKMRVKHALDYATKFYQFGDDFWKIIGFENEKQMLVEAGYSEQQAKQEAAERIRNTYPTYSMVGRGVQQLRRFPLAGTFVSFPAEIIRTSINMVKYLAEDYKNPKLKQRAIKRAAGMAIASSFAYAMQAVSMAALGYDDEDEEAVRLMAAPWQRNSNLLFTGRDEDGNIRFMDLSFLDPYNYWKRPIVAVTRGQPWRDAVKDVAEETLKPFFGVDIAAGAIFDVLANKKDSGGPVYKVNDQIMNQTADIANHLRKALQPGLFSNMERTYRAMNDEVTKTGRKYDLTDEAFAWFGFRVSTLDPKVAIYYRSRDFIEAKQESESHVRNALSDAGEVDEEDLRDAYDITSRLRNEAYTDMHRLIQAGIESGMSRSEIRAVLKNSGVSVKDSMALMSGRIPQYKPSSQTVSNLANRARNTFGQKAAQEVMDRYRSVLSYASP